MRGTLPLLFLSALLAAWPASPAQAPTGPWIVTVHDPAGAVVPGAAIRLARCDGRHFHCLDLSLRDEWVEITRATTDRRGRFGQQVPVGLAVRVEVDVPPHARWISDSVVPGVPVDVHLTPPCSVEGRLIDRETGEGRRGGVTLVHQETGIRWARGRTDDAGHFVFDRLPAGCFWLQVEPDTAMSPEWLTLTLAAGAAHTLEVPLDRGVELTGIVTDESTGEPIANARIGEGWVFHRAVHTDRTGHYVLTGCGDAGRPDLHCRAPGYEEQRIDRQGEPTGPLRQDFALRRGRSISGRIVGADGRPVADAYVAAIGANRLTVPWLPTRTAADGSFTIGGLPILQEGVLMIRCYGHASLLYTLPNPDEHDADLGVLTLPRPRVVQGTLRDRDGAPVADAVVALVGHNDDALRLGPLPQAWSILRVYVDAREMRTDANGCFAFGDVAPGSYALAIGSIVDAPPERAIVEVDGTQDTHTIDLVQ